MQITILGIDLGKNSCSYLFSHQLSTSTWLVVSKIPTSEKTGLHRMEAGDSQALLALIADLRKKVAANWAWKRRS